MPRSGLGEIPRSVTRRQGERQSTNPACTERLSNPRLQQRGHRLHTGAEPSKAEHQFIAGAYQLIDGHGCQPVDDEPQIPGRLCERGAPALPPVPPAARNTALVAPDHFSRLRVLDDRDAVAGRVEFLGAGCKAEARYTPVPRPAARRASF